jgi:hypothetical protein
VLVKPINWTADPSFVANYVTQNVRLLTHESEYNRIIAPLTYNSKCCDHCNISGNKKWDWNKTGVMVRQDQEQ